MSVLTKKGKDVRGYLVFHSGINIAARYLHFLKFNQIDYILYTLRCFMPSGNLPPFLKTKALTIYAKLLLL